MTILDTIIESQHDRLEVGSNATGVTTTTIGKAVTDSADGMVEVIIDGAVIPSETLTGTAGTHAVPLPCINPCREGDSVYISLTGNETIKTPYVIGPIGAGDRMEGEIEEAKTIGTTASEAARVAKEAADAAEIAAAEAYDAVEATNQFFWHDSNGAHISTVENDATSGPNLLLNSGGVIQRDGTNYLSTMSASGFTIYDGQGNAASNVRATFGTTTTIGQSGKAQLVMSSSTIDMTAMVNSTSEPVVHFGTDYQTIGLRTSGSTIGDQSVAAGYNNTASNYQGTAFGYNNTVSGRRAFALGGGNTVSNRFSGAVGLDNNNAGWACYMFGQGLSVSSSGYNQVIIGQYNVDGSQTFIVGGGTDNQNRANVLTIDESGWINGKTGHVTQREVLWTGNTKDSWASGGSHSITLSKSAANYRALEFAFKTADGVEGSRTFTVPAADSSSVSSAIVTIQDVFCWTGSSPGVSVKTMSLQFSGTTVSLYNNGSGNCRGQLVSDAAGTRVEAGSYIYLTAVIGHR